MEIWDAGIVATPASADTFTVVTSAAVTVWPALMARAAARTGTRMSMRWATITPANAHASTNPSASSNRALLIRRRSTGPADPWPAPRPWGGAGRAPAVVIDMVQPPLLTLSAGRSTT
jgi:hypothetical protein